MERTPPESNKRVRNQLTPEESHDNNPNKRAASICTPQDAGLVGGMTKGDLLQAFSEMLDIKLENVASKEDVKILQLEVSSVKAECDVLKKEVRRLSEGNLMLQKKLEDAEKREKMGNLIFKGLPESDKLPNDTVKQFCEEELAIENLTIKNSYRLGKKNSTQIRPILVEFVKQEDVRSILARKKEIKNTDVVVHRDRTLKERKMRNFLWELKNEVCRVNKRANVQIRNEQFIVNGTIFSCSDDCKLIPKDAKALEDLKREVGADVIKVLEDAEAKARSKGCNVASGSQGIGGR